MTNGNGAPPQGDGQDAGPARSILLRVVLRYGISTAGPVAVSGAHFLASLIFLRNLSAHEFGLFAFVMVVVSFGMSLTGSLIVVPITQSLVSGDPATRPACYRMNWLVCAGFAVLLAVALWASEAPLREALILGGYAAGFAWRWFARSLAYIDGRIWAAIASDIVYSGLLLLLLPALVFGHRMSFDHGSEVMLLATLVALLPFGRAFFAGQLAALRRGSLKTYLPVFHDVSRWAMIGVILTEITVNIHAYLVTFISGADAFALLALGMLLMRPAALVQSALPDMERPAMARAIARRDLGALNAMARYFLYGLGMAWVGNIVLCAALLYFFPEIVLKKGYSEHDVVLVAAISAAIMLLRAVRTPLAVLLQAAGAFKALAGLGAASGAVSLIATLSLLLAFGPIASLGGIFLGEVVVVARCAALVAGWKKTLPAPAQACRPGGVYAHA
jgi:O-antigen/teichoic acid export membrane protein